MAGFFEASFYLFVGILFLNNRLSHFLQPMKSGMNTDFTVQSVKVILAISMGNPCICCKLSHENIFNFV